MNRCPDCGDALRKVTEQVEQLPGGQIVVRYYECPGCETCWRALYDSFEQETTFKRISREEIGT